MGAGRLRIRVPGGAEGAVTIVEVSAVQVFRETVDAFAQAHGYKPRKAYVGAKLYARLVEEAGPILVAHADSPPEVDGVRLEVVGA